MNKDLTRGPITKSLIMFTVPMVMGNFLQQLYNIVDTIIVGKYLGQNALAAVGSSYTLMVFITSIILGVWVVEHYSQFSMAKKMKMA